MGIYAIAAIIVVAVSSVIAVFIAEEPLDEVFATKAATSGFTLPPLATKMSSPRGVRQSVRRSSRRRA